VNRHALAPRPETELLAELGWQFLSTLNLQPSTALDFGTGSGCIAIALAAKCPNAKIVATDISADALALAKQNAARHNVTERIQFQQSDGFAALSGDARFDLIISNPPYIPSAEVATLQPEVRDFDPRVALDGGTDGLDFYRLIAAHAASFLKSDGKIMLEFGDGHAQAVRKIFENEKWIVEAVKEDYSHRARILIVRQ
jgi:release factor glutamine methyltransferase